MRSPEDKQAGKMQRQKRKKPVSRPLQEPADPQALPMQIARVSVQHQELAKALLLLRKTGLRLLEASNVREETARALHHAQVIQEVPIRQQIVPPGPRPIAQRMRQAVRTGAPQGDLQHPQRVLPGQDLTLPHAQTEDLQHLLHEAPLVMLDLLTETLLDALRLAAPRNGETVVHPMQHPNVTLLDVALPGALYSGETAGPLMQHRDVIHLQRKHERFALTRMTDEDQAIRVQNLDRAAAKMLLQAAIAPPGVQLRVSATIDQERLSLNETERLKLAETIQRFVFSRTDAITGIPDRCISVKRISTALRSM